MVIRPVIYTCRYSSEQFNSLFSPIAELWGLKIFTRVSAGVDDWPCFTIFFIATIPIDYKITNFSLLLFYLFLVTIIIFGELTSTTSMERMTMNIISAGATPIY